MDIWGIIIVLFLAWCIVTDIIYLLLKITKLYTCRNITDCKNRKCLVNGTCKKYNKFLTQEEYDYLIQLVKESFPEERITKNENI